MIEPVLSTIMAGGVKPAVILKKKKQLTFSAKRYRSEEHAPTADAVHAQQKPNLVDGERSGFKARPVEVALGQWRGF